MPHPAATPETAPAALPVDLSAFAGRWDLRRTIRDRRAGRDGQGRGEAVLRPDAEGLVYEETLSLQFPGAPPMEARRRYLWRAAPQGIAVSFEDGRPFHAIALGKAAPDAAHWCDPDSYAVRYDFAGWPRWRATWEVAGPRKDYSMITDYSPAGADPS